MDVVGIDMPIMDLLLRTNKIPDHNGFTHLLDYGMQGGGKVPTALAALGRLGAKCGIIGVVGGDEFGRFCKGDLERHGVDTSHLAVDEGKTTTMCVCLSENVSHSRILFGHGGTCRRAGMEDLDRDYIASARYLHLTHMTELTRAAARIAKEAGVKVVIDEDTCQEGILDDLPLIDVFIASEFTYNAMFDNDRYEENCRALVRKGPETVIFTFGEKGCYGVSKEGFFYVPAFQIDAVDTTGAGDVFHGAYIYGLLQGWDAKYASRFSSAVSAIKCTRLGGRAGIPDLKTVQRFMQDGTIDYTEIDKRVAYYGGLVGRR